MVEPMLMKACSPNWASSPDDGEHHEQVRLHHHARKAAQHDEGEHRHQQQAADQPELLARHGEHEVGVRVGQQQLDRALARAAAEQPAMLERLDASG